MGDIVHRETLRGLMSREVELATYDRASMLYDKERLLVPEELLKRRLEFLRGEYDPEHAPEKDR